MSTEEIKSETKIFIEDEKINPNDLEEERVDSKIVAVIDKEEQVKNLVNRDVERGIDKYVENKAKMAKGKYPFGQQTAWVQFLGLGRDYGGGNLGSQDQPPLQYEPSSRNSFVKFVFMILFVMLLATVGLVSIVLATPAIKEIFLDHYLIFLIVSLIIMLAMNYMMFCSECSRRPPCNYICLVIAVLGMSLVVATITCRIRTNIIFYAFIATAAVVAVCLLLACSKFDFTKWYLYVIGITVAFVAVATVISVTMLLMNVKYKPLQIAILFIGTLLNVVILIIELQTILGGKSVEIGESDYALAAFMLYTSIIDLFLKILQMIHLFDD